MQSRSNPAVHTGAERRALGRTAFLQSCLAALAVAGVASGCAHAKAKAAVELPPLEMPAAPPRIVEPAEPQQPTVVALPDEPRTNLRPRATPAQRPEPPRAVDAPKPEVPAGPVEPPHAADEVPKPAPPTTLQTTPTQREVEVERRVRTLIAQAMNDLNRVNYQALNTDARTQYDTAKRFATQAEEAIRARNLVFASNLADKAAALAAQLLGR